MGTDELTFEKFLHYLSIIEEVRKTKEDSK